MVKSGTDFRELSKITLQFSEDKVNVDVRKIVIDSSIKEDPDTKVIVQKYTGKSCKIHKVPCIWTNYLPSSQFYHHGLTYGSEFNTFGQT